MERREKMNMVVMAMIVFLIVSMWVSFLGFIEVRETIARIEAEGIECCYMLNCSYTPFGKIECSQTHVPEVNFTGWFNESFRISGIEEKTR